MAGILPSASVSAIGGAATGDWWAPHAQRPPVAAAPSAGIGGYAGVGGVGSIGGGGSVLGVLGGGGLAPSASSSALSTATGPGDPRIWGQSSIQQIHQVSSRINVLCIIRIIKKINLMV